MQQFYHFAQPLTNDAHDVIIVSKHNETSTTLTP